MKRYSSWTAFAAMAAALCVPGQAQDSNQQPQQAGQTRTDTRKQATDAIESWPVNTKTTARALLEKYGPPDGVTANRLSWNNKDPWARITLMREGASDNFPTTHQDFVENTVRYDVPADKAGVITQFYPGLTVDRKAGTLSARSDSEQANILALNLADEIVKNKRDVDSARDFMRATLVKTMAGKSSPYTDHLMFSVQKQPE